jgi:DNA-binding MarR family transcriptional regulator
MATPPPVDFGAGGFAMDDDPPLAATVLRGAERCSRRLRLELEQRGWPPLTRNQLLLFALLPSGGERVSRLADRIGIARQSLHRIAVGLAAAELVVIHRSTVLPGPAKVLLTARGVHLVEDARRILVRMDDEVRSWLPLD